MKFLVGIGFLVIFFYQAMCEECTLNDDCHTTVCVSGTHAVCEHPADAGVQENGGLCTCSVADACTDRADCLSPNHPELDCNDDRRHCYDNACICSRWPQFGGGGVGK